MDLQLQGKRALVTGSTSGIGEATVKLLAAEGAVVAVHGRNMERAEQVAADIRSSGGKAVVAIGDLADESQALSVAEKVDAELDGIDILFNNAGGGGRRTEASNPGFLDLTPEDWAGEYEHNVLSVIRMIRHFVPGMKARGWGRIIQNASASAMSPSDTVSDYAAAKAAVVNLTVGLAKALALTGITVNTVSPGLTLTPQALSPVPGRFPGCGLSPRPRDGTTPCP